MALTCEARGTCEPARAGEETNGVPSRFWPGVSPDIGCAIPPGWLPDDAETAAAAVPCELPLPAAFELVDDVVVDADPDEPDEELVVADEPAVSSFVGNELVIKSRVVAPNKPNGFVTALSNQAPAAAPPVATKFSPVPAILARGLVKVSSKPALTPSDQTLFAFDKLVAMFCKATPVVVIGLPIASLNILA